MHRPLSQLAALVLTQFAIVTPLLALEVEGFSEPYREIDVAAAEMGRLAQVNVQEGERVKAGQILAKLDESVLHAALEIADAYKSSTGRLQAAETEFKQAQETLKRLEILLQRQHANQHEIDRARVQLTLAESRVKIAREEKSIKQLEYDRTMAQLEQRRIKSPINGVVTEILKDQGEFVSPGDPVVVRVVQLNPLTVVFSVPNENAKRLQVDGEVGVRVEQQQVSGLVEFISPTPDPQSGTTRVKVRIPNEGEGLPSGATCRLLLN